MTKKEAKYPLPIREWSEDDRPREKLLKYGEHTISHCVFERVLLQFDSHRTDSTSGADFKHDPT